MTDTAFVRLEQLCPFPAQELQDVLKIYPNVKKFVWSQEEHRNAGAWTFVRPRQVDEFLFSIIFHCAHTQKTSVERNLLRKKFGAAQYRRSWYFHSSTLYSLTVLIAGVQPNPVFLLPPSQAVSECESTFFE